MNERIKTCKHCGVRYTYYYSGMYSPFNDSEYCSECKKTMLDSLSNVEKKFTFFIVDASEEITLEELNGIIRSNGYNRILPGFMSGGDVETIHVVKKGEVEYVLSEWNIDHEYTIGKYVYWNLITDKPYDGKTYNKELKILYNEKKKANPKKFDEIKPITPLTTPLGLGFALRYKYDTENI